MPTLFVPESEMLSREVLFKPVLQWMEDAAAQFGLSVAIGGGGENALASPAIFSPLLDAGHGHIAWPGGKPLIPWGCLPIGTGGELQAARRILKEAILRHHMENGVDIVDPATTFIGPDARIGQGTTILPGVVIRGRVSVGEGCELGPFTHIRSDVSMDRNVRAGAFVEIKNSRLGSGTQMGHLAYAGDADVGERVNFGAGAVTVNFNGAEKFRTVIENDAFIGCHTSLIAPVAIRSGAYTAASSAITGEVPEKALAIARARQVNKENWQSPKDRLSDDS